MDKLSKNEKVHSIVKIFKIPTDVVNFIDSHTRYYNKASFYLHEDGFYKIEIDNNLYEELRVF